MTLAAQRARVQQAEQALQASRLQAAGHWRQLGRDWRAGWTPGRLLIAGLALGAGLHLARPLRRLGAGRAFTLLRELAPLLPALQSLLTGLAAPAASAAPGSEPAAPTTDAGPTMPP